MSTLQPKLVGSDGIHPNTNGAKELARIISLKMKD